MYYKGDVIVELANGKEITARLAHPFNQNADEIKIVLNNKENKTLTRDEICCVKMLPDKDWILSSSSEWKTMNVTTVTGRNYSIYKINGNDSYGGFYGINVESGDDKFKLIYFCSALEDPSSRLNQKSVKDSHETLRKQKGITLGHLIRTKEKLLHDAPRAGVLHGAVNKDMSRLKIGQIFLHSNLITQKQLEQTLTEQKKVKGKKIGELLLLSSLITEEQLLRALAIKLHIPFIDLKNIIPDKTALGVLPLNISKSLNVFPVESKNGGIVVATSEPGNLRMEDILRFSTGKKIEYVIATSKQISEAITNYYLQGDFGVRDLIDDISDIRTSQEEDYEQVEQIAETDSLIISLVNRLMKEAYVKGASDIHFEPGLKRDPAQVRYRIDGVCLFGHHIPSMYKNAIASRIKILARLDISERRRPQSGKISMRYGHERVEFRVEITPTTGDNEDIVLRLLNSSKLFQLEELGFTDTNLRNFKEAVSKPYGMILCVGPTGSGKTSTLHAALAHVNTPDRKIWTAEDPVEIIQKGLRQVQVNPKIGYTFAEALRSFLRSDPDVIMIGEMRDTETAKTALNASLTGHLVLSTLHTNNAPETLIRLIEMGMNPLNFADAILGVLSQRLTRKLCDFCKESYHPDYDEYKALVDLYGAGSPASHNLPDYTDNVLLMRAKGCDRCEGSGYKGRIALHEFLKATREIKTAIKNKEAVEDIRNLALSLGMKTLIMDGVLKVFNGLTDMKQVLRVAL